MASSLTLLVGIALLAVTGARLASSFGAASPTTFLLGAFVLAQAELLLVAVLLSGFRAFTPVFVIVTVAGICAVVLVATRNRRRRTGIDWRAAFRVIGSDPILVVLAVAAALGFAYTVALALGTPQVEDDALTFHLVRAALWRQHHGFAYVSGIFDGRINSYPPGGELGPFTTMTLAGSDRFVALDQALACLALALGVAGIGRRIGLARRQAAFGALLVLTLPIVVLQAGTAMSDLVPAGFLLAAALFLLDGGRASPWLAGIATLLAIDAKPSAPLGLPLLFAIAWLARPPKRHLRLVAVAVGAVIGSFWYVVNLTETGGSAGQGVSANEVSGGSLDLGRSAAGVIARAVRYGIELIDLSGATGRDRFLYGASALVVIAVAALCAARPRSRTTLTRGAIAALVALTPIVLLPLAHRLVRADVKTWLKLGRPDLAYIDAGRDITTSTSNFSWYGPLGSLALVVAGVLAVRAVRRGRLDRLAVLFVLATFYWLVVLAVLFPYLEWAGRYVAFPMALAAATWGILLPRRALAWGVAAIAVTTLLLALANDGKRPSGLPLVERDKPRSIWHTSRSIATARRPDQAAPITFLDRHVPDSATVALAITPKVSVYPFFGPGLDRRVTFVRPADRSAPGAAWVFVAPGRRISLCAGDWRTVEVTTAGWRILQRTAARDCGQTTS